MRPALPCPARWMPRTLAVRMSPSTEPRYFTEPEVARHRTKDSCWVLLGTRVYDVTAFLRMHPGGGTLILRRSGEDVSRAMEGPPHRHSENARRWMEQYYIGELMGGGGGGGAEDEAQVSRSAPVASSSDLAVCCQTQMTASTEKMSASVGQKSAKAGPLSFPSVTFTVFGLFNCGNSGNMQQLRYYFTPAITPEVSIILIHPTTTHTVLPEEMNIICSGIVSLAWKL